VFIFTPKDDESIIPSPGIPPNGVVNLLAAHEKQVFLSNSDEEKTDKKTKAREEKYKEIRGGSGNSKLSTTCTVSTNLPGIVWAETKNASLDLLWF